jgi:hypothetical protein
MNSLPLKKEAGRQAGTRSTNLPAAVNFIARPFFLQSLTDETEGNLFKKLFDVPLFSPLLSFVRLWMEPKNREREREREIERTNANSFCPFL